MLTGFALEQLHGVTFKKRAPRAIKEIKAFAYKSMVGKNLSSTPQNHPQASGTTREPHD